MKFAQRGFALIGTAATLGLLRSSQLVLLAVLSTMSIQSASAGLSFSALSGVSEFASPSNDSTSAPVFGLRLGYEIPWKDAESGFKGTSFGAFAYTGKPSDARHTRMGLDVNALLNEKAVLNLLLLGSGVEQVSNAPAAHVIFNGGIGRYFVLTEHIMLTIHVVGTLCIREPINGDAAALAGLRVAF